MAECHPVGFQWVMEAKARGAKIVHVDPRFTRTSAVADLHVPLRAGTDIAFLGGLIKYVLDNEKYFKEYVVAYTNAAALLREDFQDTDDLDGLFSGFDPEQGHYDESTWEYQGADVGAAAGQRAPDEPGGKPAREARSGAQAGEHGHDVKSADQYQAAGSGGPVVRVKPERDETLQHPRCVFQVFKRHFSRYTPEMVAEVCGVEPAAFLQMAVWFTATSCCYRSTRCVYAYGGPQ